MGKIISLNNRIRTILFLGVFYLASSAFNLVMAQEDHWNTLGMVTVEKKFDPDFGIEIIKPNVSPIAMQLAGKEIEVTGYYIALTGKTAQSHFMLSRYTQSMCFFCGKAGPETAMQVFMANDVKVAYTEEKITVKGILSINPKSDSGLLYTLTQAKLIK